MPADQPAHRIVLTDLMSLLSSVSLVIFGIVGTEQSSPR